MHTMSLSEERTWVGDVPFSSYNLASTVKSSERTSLSRGRQRCRQCFRNLCIYLFTPCLVEHNPLPADPSLCAQLRYAFLCPPHGTVAQVVSLSASVIAVWSVLWAVTGDAALPGGNHFAIIMLLVTCSGAGVVVSLVRLPALLGMLIMGCVLRNLPLINVAKDIHPTWSLSLRTVALVVILTRAGLGLDPVALKKLSFGVLRLAFSPCLVEMGAAAVSSHFLLGFPWLWGLMLGFVLAAVSPAVVVPSMLSLCEQGYGVDKGIPTLVIAASSLDDVLAISGFGVILGITFSEGDLAISIVKGPLEAVAGVVYGIVFGLFAWYLPNKQQKNVVFLRTVLLLSGGLLAAFGSRKADISGAGALGCLSLSFVAALGWRKEVDEDEKMPVEKIMASMWTFFQPLLFGLIGAEIDITVVKVKTIALGLAVLAIGLALRLVVSFLVVFRLGLNTKEKLFIALAWLPKATVQAAIGSVALDTAREKNASDDQIEYGLQLLTIAVLVILITAPLGAIAIATSAPYLLERSPEFLEEIEMHAPDDQSESESANVCTDICVSTVNAEPNGFFVPQISVDEGR